MDTPCTWRITRNNLPPSLQWKIHECVQTRISPVLNFFHGHPQHGTTPFRCRLYESQPLELQALTRLTTKNVYQPRDEASFCYTHPSYMGIYKPVREDKFRKEYNKQMEKNMGKMLLRGHALPALAVCLHVYLNLTFLLTISF